MQERETRVLGRKELQCERKHGEGEGVMGWGSYFWVLEMTRWKWVRDKGGVLFLH